MTAARPSAPDWEERVFEVLKIDGLRFSEPNVLADLELNIAAALQRAYEEGERKLSRLAAATEGEKGC